MNNKIVFMDFDNTLYSHFSHGVPESVYTALDILKNKGIKTCLSTGRCKYEVVNFFDLPRLKFDYYIYFNGQIILDDKDEIIFSSTIDGIDKENIIKVFNEKTMPVVLGSKDDYYINYINDQVYYTCVECSSCPVPNIHEYVPDDMYMASIFPGKIDNLDEFVKKNFPNCYTSTWTEGSYDLLLKGQSKARGVNALLDYLNIDAKNAYAFGDAENDIEMMKCIGTSIAMGNAKEDVKKVATYVTTHIDDDGIYNGLKYYNLI